MSHRRKLNVKCQTRDDPYETTRYIDMEFPVKNGYEIDNLTVMILSKQNEVK